MQITKKKLSYCLPVFLVKDESSFAYYKWDQTKNTKPCCAIFFQKMYECSPS